MMILLIFGGVIGFTVVSIVFMTWRARGRSRGMSQAAQELGLSYERDGSAILKDGLTELPIFTLAAFGTNNTISNLIAGNIDGSAIKACDYAYWTGSVNTQRFDYAQTVVCFHLTPNRYP